MIRDDTNQFDHTDQDRNTVPDTLYPMLDAFFEPIREEYRRTTDTIMEEIYDHPDPQSLLSKTFEFALHITRWESSENFLSPKAMQYLDRYTRTHDHYLEFLGAFADQVIYTQLSKASGPPSEQIYRQVIHRLFDETLDDALSQFLIRFLWLLAGHWGDLLSRESLRYLLQNLDYRWREAMGRIALTEETYPDFSDGEYLAECFLVSELNRYRMLNHRLVTALEHLSYLGFLRDYFTFTDFSSTIREHILPQYQVIRSEPDDTPIRNFLHRLWGRVNAGFLRLWYRFRGEPCITPGCGNFCQKIGELNNYGERKEFCCDCARIIGFIQLQWFCSLCRSRLT